MVRHISSVLWTKSKNPLRGLYLLAISNDADRITLDIPMTRGLCLLQLLCRSDQLDVTQWPQAYEASVANFKSLSTALTSSSHGVM